MIHFESKSNPGIPSVFVEKIREAQCLLDERGVPYRLLGSVATFSYLRNKVDWRLKFDRSRFLPRHQQVPDLDFLVPQAYLGMVEQIRQKLLSDKNYPINMELLSGLCHFDWRPEEEYSYLVHRKLRVPYASSLFEETHNLVGGVAIKTVEHTALLHTYVTMGVTLRKKDRACVRGLAQMGNIGSSCGQAFRPFHYFIQERSKAYKGYILSRVVGEKLRCTLPPAIYYWIVNAGKRVQPYLFSTGSAE